MVLLLKGTTYGGVPMTDNLFSKLREDFPEAWAEIQRLTALVEKLQQQLQQALDGNEKLHKLLTEMQEKLDVLIAQSKKRNKREYGKKTEKFNPRPAINQPKPAAPAHRDSLVGKKHIFDNTSKLEAESVQHLITPEKTACPMCLVDTVFVSNRVTNQLEMVSACLKVLEHCQETRACPKCKQYIVTAEKPSSPIPGSYAGPRLLAEIIVGKLDSGLPNYRQEKIFARHNLTIPRSTQCDWMKVTAETLSLLYELQKSELLKSKVIKTDDSSIKIQDRGNKNNIRKGKITAYVGDAQHPITMFDYSPDLTFTRNAEFIADFQGIVQLDAAGGFDALFLDGKRTEAGCHAHSRRKYFEAGFAEDELRTTVLDIYRQLYTIEREIKDCSPLFRRAIRRRRSKPLIKSLWKRLQSTAGNYPPSSEISKAINYTLKHWRALTVFLKDPNVAIDNNESERAIKTWVLVRKNSLFAGSNAGGKAIATHLSFIATAKRNGINPVDWYADVLSRINDMKTSALHQLLPTNWSPPRS
jgi:transposase